jgi:hypothetical protein
MLRDITPKLRLSVLFKWFLLNLKLDPMMPPKHKHEKAPPGPADDFTILHQSYMLHLRNYQRKKERVGTSQLVYPIGRIRGDILYHWIRGWRQMGEG